MSDIYLILSSWPINIVYIILSAGHPLAHLKHHIVIILSSYLTCIWTEGAHVTGCNSKQHCPVPFSTCWPTSRLGMSIVTTVFTGFHWVWLLALVSQSWFGSLCLYCECRITILWAVQIDNMMLYFFIEEVYMVVWLHFTATGGTWCSTSSLCSSNHLKHWLIEVW